MGPVVAALTDQWPGLVASLAAMGALALAIRKEPRERESAISAEALGMVSALQADRAADREEIASLRERLARAEHELERALADRDRERELAREREQSLERQVQRLYTRLEELEGRVGGRREDDEPS